MRNKEKIKREILEGARDLFYEKGFRNVSMDELARTLNKSKKTIYNYFSSKEQLIDIIFEEYKKNITSMIGNLMDDRSLSFAEKLKGMMTSVGIALSGMSSVFLRDIEYNMPTLWSKVIQYKNEAAYLRFNRLIEEGILDGQIRKEVNRSVVVALYASAIHNLFDPKFLSHLPESIQNLMPRYPADIFDHVMEIIYEGILVKDAQEHDVTKSRSGTGWLMSR